MLLEFLVFAHDRKTTREEAEDVKLSTTVLSLRLYSLRLEVRLFLNKCRITANGQTDESMAKFLRQQALRVNTFFLLEFKRLNTVSENLGRWRSLEHNMTKLKGATA